MKTTFIYTLTDPRTGRVRYVGKTDVPGSRAKTHLRSRDKTIRSKWVQSLLAAGVEPVLEILDEVPFDEWMFWEQHWIQVMRGWGFDLVNGDNGGLGHFRLTAEVTAKIAATMTGRTTPERWKEISCYTLAGILIRTFPSAQHAEAELPRCHHANIARGIRIWRRAGGYLWAYGHEPGIVSAYVNGKVPVSDKKREASRQVGLAKRGSKMSDASRERMRVSALRRWASS